MPRSMFSIKSDVKDWTRKMNRVNKELLPKAIVATVNRAGKAAHSRSIRNVKSMLTVRSSYTLGSMIFSPAKVRSSGVAGYAVTGSKSRYLPIQEKGGVVRARRKRIAVPTTFARGGSKRNVIQKEYKMRAMGQVAGFKQQYTKKGRKKRGKGFFYLPGRGGHKPGIFIRQDGQLRMVRDLSLRRYRLKPTHWHTEAVKKYGNKRVMGQVFVQEAKRQLAKVR